MRAATSPGASRWEPGRASLYSVLQARCPTPAAPPCCPDLLAWNARLLYGLRPPYSLPQRLRELGFDYGSMPAHNLLWEGCEMSAADLGARLAIVPMSQVGGWLIG